MVLPFKSSTRVLIAESLALVCEKANTSAELIQRQQLFILHLCCSDFIAASRPSCSAEMSLLGSCAAKKAGYDSKKVL